MMWPSRGSVPARAAAAERAYTFAISATEVISAGNRRRHDRVSLRVPVEIGAGSRGVVRAETVDVSLSGASIRVQEGMSEEIADEVVLVISPGDRIIPARGRVVRRMSAEDLVGIEFLRVSPGPRRTLRAWLGDPRTVRRATPNG